MKQKRKGKKSGAFGRQQPDEGNIVCTGVAGERNDGRGGGGVEGGWGVVDVPFRLLVVTLVTRKRDLMRAMGGNLNCTV